MMKTLKNYEQLIRETVREMDAKDPNWRWSVHSIEDSKVLIRWGYLDYMEAKNPFFSLIMSEDYDDNDYPGERWISVRLHDGELLTGEFVSHHKRKHSWQVSWESGIKCLLCEIEHCAHSRY